MNSLNLVISERRLDSLLFSSSAFHSQLKDVILGPRPDSSISTALPVDTEQFPPVQKHDGEDETPPDGHWCHSTWFRDCWWIDYGRFRSDCWRPSPIRYSASKQPLLTRSIDGHSILIVCSLSVLIISEKIPSTYFSYCSQIPRAIKTFLRLRVRMRGRALCDRQQPVGPL